MDCERLTYLEDLSTWLTKTKLSFTTAFGGFWSLIAYGVILYVVYTLSSILVNKNKMSTFQKSTYYDYTNSIQDHKILTNGLKLAFKLYEKGTSSSNNTFYIGAELVTTYNKTYTEKVYLQTEDWSFNDFAGSTTHVDYQEFLSWFSFPENVTLAGNYYSEVYSYVRIVYWYSNWKTDEECKIVSLQENVYAYLQVHVVAPYVDYEDINEPIKYAYLNKYYTYIDPSSFTFYDLFIRK